MITIKITSWEREPHSYCRRPQPRGGTTPASWREEATSMEMNPGALPHPSRVSKQEILVPRSLLAMAAEIGIASGKRSSSFRVFASGVKIRAKGGCQGWPPWSRRPGGAATLLAAQGGRLDGGWPPPVVLRASEVFRLGYFFSIFSGIFRALLVFTFFCNARTKTNRNWHWALGR